MTDGAVGTRLQHLRIKARLSQKQAGRLIGVSLPTYAKIEIGRRSLKAREAAVFAEQYGVDARWIVVGQSLKECKLVDISREPESVPVPHIAIPFVSHSRRAG